MDRSKQLEARYANYFQVGHNAFEFVIEFGQLYSEDTAPLLHTRVVTNPIYVKDLLTILQDALSQHERQYGPVRKSEL